MQNHYEETNAWSEAELAEAEEIANEISAVIEYEMRDEIAAELERIIKQAQDMPILQEWLNNPLTS